MWWLNSNPNDETLYPIPGLQKGDRLVLTRDHQPGHAARHDGSGRLLMPATIGCTIPEVFDRVESGEPIWFDDGKIGGVIEKVDERQVLVLITRAGLGGIRLRADKGINLPESALVLPALTAKDIQDLSFAAQHAVHAPRIARSRRGDGMIVRFV